jgi:GNAT superfamily N-acetyltransferase
MTAPAAAGPGGPEPPGAVSVREAAAAEHQAVRGVLAAAYRQFDAVLPPAAFEGYLADLLDLGARSDASRLLVAEQAGRIVGTVTFFEDARDEGAFGWPAGWSGLRALGVDPSARRRGIGRLLMEACRDRARAAGATVLCLHTAAFMTAAVVLYEAMGFRRVPSFDFDAARFLDLGMDGERPIPVIAYRLDLS